MKGREKNEYIWRGNRRGGLSGITWLEKRRKERGRERTESKMGANHERDRAGRQEETEDD